MQFFQWRRFPNVNIYQPPQFYIMSNILWQFTLFYSRQEYSGNFNEPFKKVPSPSTIRPSYIYSLKKPQNQNPSREVFKHSQSIDLFNYLKAIFCIWIFLFIGSKCRWGFLEDYKIKIYLKDFTKCSGYENVLSSLKPGK